MESTQGNRRSERCPVIAGLTEEIYAASVRDSNEFPVVWIESGPTQSAGSAFLHNRQKTGDPHERPAVALLPTAPFAPPFPQAGRAGGVEIIQTRPSRTARMTINPSETQAVGRFGDGSLFASDASHRLTGERVRRARHNS